MSSVKNMLEQAGIKFDDLASKGIDYSEFCEVVTGSGIINYIFIRINFK